MNPHRTSSRSGFTWVELAAIIVVVSVLLALLAVFFGHSREAARRINCSNNLKEIALGLHNYHNAHKMFPPGATCSAANITADTANPWADANLTTQGASGTSWILPLLPYIEAQTTFKAWNFKYGVGDTRPYTIPQSGNQGTAAAPGVAAMDALYWGGLFCPARRSRLRPGVDNVMMLQSWWQAGGTDYGGCMGRHQGFLLDADQSMTLPDAKDRLKLAFVPGVDIADATFQVVGDTSSPDATCEAKRGFGIFGRVNVGTTIQDVAKDGTSNTIMTGELQRITTVTKTGPFNASSGPIYSHDGWAIGGSPTLFSTGCPYPPDATIKRMMNNGYFMSPGSDHSGGANFGIADGSVRYINTTVDPNIFSLLGSMNDDRASTIPDD
jgi:prepilin-type processing-associated H-X9-DG protein